MKPVKYNGEELKTGDYVFGYSVCLERQAVGKVVKLYPHSSKACVSLDDDLHTILEVKEIEFILR